ncbi:MAG: tetratricopeptide repeat protein [Xanthobacteraceae bacterium]|jgi:hypothetical protein
MACGCSIRKALAPGLILLAVGFVAPASSTADPFKAVVNVDVSGGYARLVFAMSEDVDASVRTAGNVLIVSFNKPVLVSVDRLAAQAPDYIGAARRDPNGQAVRLALARKVTVNSMSAGEKFFVDLLPDTWSGAPPGLPQQVIEELARRARAAERLARLEHGSGQQKKLAPVRVHVASQPTFVRYVFDVPDQTAVSADRAKDRLTLTFDAPFTFDLADAEAALPAAVAAIESEVTQDSALVRFSFLGKIDVRTFRDDKGYVVDIVDADTIPAEHGEAAQKAPANPALETGPSERAVSEGAAPSAVETPAAPAAPAAPAEKPNVAAPATIVARAPAAAAKVEPAASAPQPPAPAAAVATPDGAAGPARGTPRDRKAGDTVAVELSRQGANLKLSFPFMTPTAASVFHRADTLWIVFDSKSAIDLSALEGEASRTIRGAELIRTPDADIVRIRLDHPHLSSVATEGPAWTVTIGDTVFDPTRALDIVRNMIGPNRASVTIPFEEPHQLHRIGDPQVGDQLLVVTGFAPARGFINEQDFVEFHALASTQGVVVEPLADDVNVELAADKIVISRPGGLTLSSSLHSVLRGSALRPVMFDSQLWGSDRQSTYSEQQSRLIDAAAVAPSRQRLKPRLDLARFYIARDMYAEAKGVLDVALAENRSAVEDIAANVLRAVAEVMMNRPDDALKDLASPAIGEQHDAPLWRALAYACQGKWAQARDGFKSVEAAIATLPIELQRVALQNEMRAAIEVGDFAGAADQLNDLETIGLPRELQPAISVLIGRLSEGMGRSEDALSAYRTAADSWDRPAAAQGRLREVVLRYALGDLKREDVVSELETLTTIWRGDETEVEALQILARLYTDAGRYRDSFYVMRSAMAAHPNSDMTRRIQEAAAVTFEALFLAGKGDALPAVDALALFYDFRELTPIGRRGDEMIRRLADRLVSVDLLDQAADLLQYQVDHRLQGAARAQVATRLAVIYLMNRKADRALATLRATRTADVATELRNQRLLLEARALSDLSRHDLALEVVANIEGREAIRLRSDILWAARRWGQSAEQIELLYGERWKEWQPLNEVERADILRAAIGYALGEDALGLSRLREKYAAKMAPTPDARAFEIVAAPLGTSGAEFRDIARAAASVDTLEGFLRDMQARYPEASAIPPAAPAAAPATPGGAPISSAAPETRPAAPAPVSAPVPPRASGHTAQR